MTGEANLRRAEQSTVPSSDGVDLRLHDFGGSGPPVLAAHATGFNGLAWTPLARALAGRHVVAPDFRAHGGSAVSRGADLDWNRFADDVLATVDTVGWDALDASPRPVGVGHSMGGAALLLAELRRPGTFAGLWVFEPIIFPPEVRALSSSVDNPLSAGARRRRPSFASRAEAIATYASKPPMNRFTDEALAGYVEAGFVDEADGSVRLACRPEDEARIYTTASTCTAFEQLGSVTCPVAVVRGAIAELSPAAIAGPAAEALAHGRLVAHDELSHFGPMEDPVGLAAEIEAFVATLDT
ncbi:MAG TPA: alpha/beta hydrolase [Acidimicrobiales bacterium]|nr:alpha/beta hydrolase [Acidimicrobiales bacterium]